MAQAPAAAGVGDIATQAARRRTFAIVSHLRDEFDLRRFLEREGRLTG